MENNKNFAEYMSFALTYFTSSLNLHDIQSSVNVTNSMEFIQLSVNLLYANKMNHYEYTL